MILENNSSMSEERLERETSKLPTIGERMRAVSQAVHRLYRDELSHKVSRVNCNMMSDKLVIWIEDSVTSVGRILYQQEKADTQSLCSALQKVVHQRVIDIIERDLGVKVITLVSDTCYEKECTGLIAWLSERPEVREPKGVFNRRSQVAQV